MLGAVHGILIAGLSLAIAAAAAFAINVATTPRLTRPTRPDPPRWPRVSVVIPARDEAREIEAAVRSQLAQDYPDVEVVAVDDRSTDGTRAILDAAVQARTDSRLRVVAGTEPPPGWLGKPHALDQGARAADGELLLFVDADVRYDPRTLREAVRLLEADRIDLLALLPRFETRGFWESVLMPYVPISYYFGLGFLGNWDRFRPLAAGGGAGNLVRRSAYESAGGHAALRNSVIDDVRLAIRLKRAGFRCRMAESDGRVRVRMYRGFREVFDGFTKNVSYVFGGWLGAALLLFTAVSLAAAVAPPAVLAAYALGAPVTAADARLAAAVFVLTVALRAALAVRSREPIWAVWTQPLMSAVWAAIIARSLYWRYVLKQTRWRGRRYDSADVRF